MQPANYLQLENRRLIFENVVFDLGSPAPNHCDTIDLYPLNGTCKNRPFKLSDFLRKSHRDELSEHLRLVSAKLDPLHVHVRCVVIDFKDAKVRYDNKEEIVKTENAFCKAMNDPEVDYYLLEGSLKHDLLNRSLKFSYLQDEEKGRVLLCQICEVVMNAFKEGCDVTDGGFVYRHLDYVRGNYRRGSKLVTLYPRYYEEAYSIQSVYFKLVSGPFTKHEKNEGILVITLG